MKKEYTISMYLDTRRAKANGKYPVKLRVYSSLLKDRKLYPTVFELTEVEFKNSWETAKPKSEFRDLRNKMILVEQKAIEAAEKATPFSYEKFEKYLFQKSGDSTNVLYHFNESIATLESNEQYNTAESYRSCITSLSEFTKSIKKDFAKISFFEITPDFLNKYEHFMLSKGRSITTIGIYLRPLRAIFNKAIAENEINTDLYPFGIRKYQIPASSKVKKALTREQLKALFNADPKTPEQEKAKDFFFFSYSCNGMNMKDILLLRNKDIENDRFEFFRAKTKRTSKKNLKSITIYLNEFSKSVIDKYRGTRRGSDDFVFPILESCNDAKEQQVKIKNFTRFVNQHIGKVCKDNNLPEASTYWARHSFATNAIRSGASMEFIQESLGHGNLSTTQNYFAGFDDEAKKGFSENIMNFD